MSFNELDRVRKLNELSFKILKELSELQQVRGFDKISKEDLIYSLLRSQNPNEDKYIKLLTSTFDKSKLDNEIKEEINNINKVVSRLGNLLTNKERNKITKELNNILIKVNNKDKNTRLRNRQKENILIKLIKQHNSLAKNEKYMDLNYDDLQYQGISGLKNTFNITNVDNNYEADLIASAFDERLCKHYERYRIKGNKNKELSLNFYLDTVRKNVVELITKKNIGERKVQLVLSVFFINYLNNEEAEKYTYSDNVELRTTDYSNIITTTLYNSLIKKYQETLENKMQGSSFVFD